MTTEKRVQKVEGEPARVKGRSVVLISIGLLLLAVGFVLLAIMVERPIATKHEVGIPALIALAVGIVCCVLGCIPFRARLMTLGILLLGITAAIAAWAASERIFRERGSAENAALCGLVIAVTGLSGLVCAALGFARLMGRTKGS